MTIDDFTQFYAATQTRTDDKQGNDFFAKGWKIGVDERQTLDGLAVTLFILEVLEVQK